jgi:predicted TIM-barrel fold metal-dependent hydrolase
LSRESPYPAAIIAKCDLASPRVEAQIEAHLAAGPVVGIREPVHASSDPRYAGHGTPDRLAALTTAPGLGVLAAKGLLLEVVSFFPQVPDLIRLLNAHPDLLVVINHACMPVHLDQGVPPFADPEAGWRRAVAELSRLPQVRMKISGLWMAGRRLTVPEVRPIVRHVLDCFGIDRCMFASNFPVDRVHIPYRDMMQTYLDCIDDVGDHDVAALFADNARKLYRIR